MAHVILVISGLADDPHEELDERTPLAAARTPALDRLAARSRVGLIEPVPDRPPDDPAIGADLTTLALLGYERVFTGRGALELLGAGATLERRDSGFRLDLLATSDGLDPFPDPPSPAEAESLWTDLTELWCHGEREVRAVSPVCALGLWSAGPVEVAATPPGELTDPEAQGPTGDREDELRALIDDARELLSSHPVNRRRAEEERPTFDWLWPWGFGRAPALRLFALTRHLLPIVLTDNRAVRGAALAAGISAPAVAERTPAQLASAIREALELTSTVVAHTSLVDRVSHRGDREAKVAMIERLDRELVAPLSDSADAFTVLGDFACLAGSRRHANRPVPYLAYSPARPATGPAEWTEESVALSERHRAGAADIAGWLWSV